MLNFHVNRKYVIMITLPVSFPGVTYRGSHYIQPELSQSQLSFSDLFLDADTGRVRPAVPPKPQTAEAAEAAEAAEQQLMKEAPLSCRSVLERSGRASASLCGAAE